MKLIINVYVKLFNLWFNTFYLLIAFSSLYSMSNNESAYILSKGLSNKRIIIQHPKEKPPCPNPVLPLNVSEGDQTHCEDYNDDQNGTPTYNL